MEEQKNVILAAFVEDKETGFMMVQFSLCVAPGKTLQLLVFQGMGVQPTFFEYQENFYVVWLITATMHEVELLAHAAEINLPKYFSDFEVEKMKDCMMPADFMGSIEEI